MKRRPRRPFVSGLPPRDLFVATGRTVDHEQPPFRGFGRAWLERIRQQAESDAALTAPMAQRRFDGERAIPADPAAAAAHETYLAVAALVDSALEDRALETRLGAILARRGPPPRMPDT